MSLASLNHLLKASSKETIEKIINLVFVARVENVQLIIPTVKELLELDNDADYEELTEALLECIETTLISGDLDGLAGLFQEKGTEVNGKLKQLIGQIISHYLEQWRESAALNRVSLPQLVDIDWAMHVQRSSNKVSAMEIPTILVELHIAQNPEKTGVPPAINKIGFELSKEALHTMLDGLGRIRDQLNSMG